MEENKREIGGSSVSVSYGKYLARIAARYQKRADRYIKKGTKRVVANPVCKFINPFTLVFNFTVDNTEKFQYIHQGNYKDQYRKWKEKVDSYDEKMVEYLAKNEEYKGLDDKSTMTAPVEPRISESPLDNKEMFILILCNKNKWFKKV